MTETNNYIEYFKTFIKSNYIVCEIGRCRKCPIVKKCGQIRYSIIDLEDNITIKRKKKDRINEKLYNATKYKKIKTNDIKYD